MAGQLAFTGLGVFDSEDHSAEHALMHREGEPHHHCSHRIDTTLHVDDSAASFEHPLIDDDLQAAALLQADFGVYSAERPPRPEALPELAPSPPNVAGLRQPRRTLSRFRSSVRARRRAGSRPRHVDCEPPGVP